MKKNNSVYLILSETNTGVGLAIRLLTNFHFNHSSLALSDDLDELYSFGRLRKSPFLVGGFIVEKPSRYLAKHLDINIRVYKLDLPAKEYKILKQRVDYYLANKNETVYNCFSAVCTLFNKRINAKDAFTCCEFVQSLLGYDGVSTIKGLTELYEQQLIYQGSYRNYLGLTSTAFVAPDQDYEERSPLLTSLGNTYTHIHTLLDRVVDARNHP